jgi:hypothetical protein
MLARMRGDQTWDPMRLGFKFQKNLRVDAFTQRATQKYIWHAQEQALNL